MASEYIVNNVNSGNGLPVRNASSGKIEKNLKRLLIIAAIVLGAELIWLFGISPCIPLSTLEVKGFPEFDGDAVLEYAGINSKTSFISVNVKDIEKIIASHPLVESVKIVKRYPDRLSLYLQPRKAVALSMAAIDGRPVPVYFDKHGVVFRIGSWQDTAQFDLPVVSGIVITDVQPGLLLPSALKPFLAELALIEEQTPVLLEAISEIKINRKSFNDYDLTLYPRHNPVRVRLGKNINEEILKYVLVMLNVFETQSALPQEIDFRSIISPYSVKEVPID